MKYFTSLIPISTQASPSMRREWIEMTTNPLQILLHMSPSMRREWIEIDHMDGVSLSKVVSLHAEGVD